MWGSLSSGACPGSGAVDDASEGQSRRGTEKTIDCIMDRGEAKITIQIRTDGCHALSEHAQLYRGHVMWLGHEPQPHLTLLAGRAPGLSFARRTLFGRRETPNRPKHHKPYQIPTRQFSNYQEPSKCRATTRRPTQDSGSAIVFIQDSLLSSLLSWQGNFDQAEHIASQDAYRSRPQM